jgi:hydroxypyruvate reductase/glycerate 2-kinase
LRNCREDALAIWNAAVQAALPGPLIERFFDSDPLAESILRAPRVIVVGAGKASAGMAEGLERALGTRSIEGIVNVPEGASTSLSHVRLHAARPQGSNEPTAAGVAGAEEMLRLLASAGRDDVAVCLLSGGGSALLPAPADSISLENKLAVTKLLHRCGATIDEMNCIRKHLSRVKGGRLAEAFHGKLLVSLIISDVVGDPLDVIASGPTSPDPTTFADALAVIARFGLKDRLPESALDHLARGAKGEIAETPKSVPSNVVNRVIGSNRLSLDAAAREAAARGYCVLDLGSFIEGETRQVAIAITGVIRSIQRDRIPIERPACILIGGETTVTLGDHPGKGGRNQEFVLAILAKLGADGMRGVTTLSGGTDGEDGPTDAAGAVADESTWNKAKEARLSIEDHLTRHDAYAFFAATGGLIRCGLTGTNVMDVRVISIK